MPDVNRRDFITSAAAAAILAPSLSRAAIANDVPWAGERIVDCHFHERPTPEAMLAHLDGAGVSSALILAFSDFGQKLPDLRKRYPGRFLGWARGAKISGMAGVGLGGAMPPEYDMTKAFAGGKSNSSIVAFHLAKTTGWKGFAETAGPVEVDGPELQRLYGMAGELDVPVMMHFQEALVPGQPAYGIRGFSRIEPMLRKFPKTRFVCHASDFWGNIDAQYEDGGAYPMGKVNQGGLSDRLLADYANMYGDFGAPSGLIQLARDPEFTSSFLQRHQHKLMFGSDCGCTDGRGGRGAPIAPPVSAAAPAGAPIGTSSAGSLQQRMAAQGGLAGKCIARELLTIAWTSTPRDVFRRLVWSNARSVYRLDI